MKVLRRTIKTSPCTPEFKRELKELTNGFKELPFGYDSLKGFNAKVRLNIYVRRFSGTIGIYSELCYIYYK